MKSLKDELEKMGAQVLQFNSPEDFEKFIKRVNETQDSSYTGSCNGCDSLTDGPIDLDTPQSLHDFLDMLFSGKDLVEKADSKVEDPSDLKEDSDLKSGSTYDAFCFNSANININLTGDDADEVGKVLYNKIRTVIKEFKDKYPNSKVHFSYSESLPNL